MPFSIFTQKKGQKKRGCVKSLLGKICTIKISVDSVITNMK